MYFYNNKTKKIFKKNKKIKIFSETKIDMTIINFFLDKYPKLSSGRKNYKKKEINNAKNICLSKIYKQAKKKKEVYISNILYKEKRNKVIITAILNL